TPEARLPRGGFGTRPGSSGGGQLVEVDDGQAHLGAEGVGDLVQGGQAGRDVARLQPSDGRLGGPDPLGQLALAQPLLLPQGPDFERQPDGPPRLLVATTAGGAVSPGRLDV